MFIVHVFVRVKTEFIEAFQAATIENAAHSVLEPGIARFDVLQQAGDATRFTLVEVYRDAEAPARHKETAHYQAWAARVAEMLAAPRTRAVYANIYPPDQGW